MALIAFAARGLALNKIAPRAATLFHARIGGMRNPSQYEIILRRPGNKEQAQRPGGTQWENVELARTCAGKRHAI